MVYEESKLPDSVRNYIRVGTIDKLPADQRAMVKVTPQASQGLFYLHKSMSLVTDTITHMIDVKGQLVPVKTVTQESCPKRYYLLPVATMQVMKKPLPPWAT
jgi:hypothetical protein